MLVHYKTNILRVSTESLPSPYQLYWARFRLQSINTCSVALVIVRWWAFPSAEQLVATLMGPYIKNQAEKL